MEKDAKCKPSSCYKSHCGEIFGAILLAIGVILTLITFSDWGILGMFLVGGMFCCHKHWRNKSHCDNSDCGCDCPCCSGVEKKRPLPLKTKVHTNVVHTEKKKVTTTPKNKQ